MSDEILSAEAFENVLMEVNEPFGGPWSNVELLLTHDAALRAERDGLVTQLRGAREEPHRYTVDVIVHGAEQYPCIICGLGRRAAPHAEHPDAARVAELTGVLRALSDAAFQVTITAPLTEAVAHLISEDHRARAVLGEQTP